MLESTERHPGEVAAGIVDPDEARVDFPRQAIGFWEIARPDTRREPEIQRIREHCELRLIVPGQHRLHGAEDFLPGDAHAGSYLVEDRGEDEVAMLQCGVGRATASCY